jgi:hypothetical protein
MYREWSVSDVARPYRPVAELAVAAAPPQLNDGAFGQPFF